MANSKPANSLEMLLQRKRPAKTRSPEDTWSLDDLKNASGMHGIREFVEQAAAPVRPADPRVEFPPPDKTIALGLGGPEPIALNSIAIDHLDTAAKQQPIATEVRAIESIAISSDAMELGRLKSIAIKSLAPETAATSFSRPRASKCIGGSERRV